MGIEKLIEQLNNLEFVAYGYNINGEVLGMECTEFECLMVDAATALSTLQVENQALRNSANGFKTENERLRDELKKVKREKDAAVESIPHECKTCVYHTVFFNGCTLDHDCTNPDGCCSNNYDRWKWRGPQKED